MTLIPTKQYKWPTIQKVFKSFATAADSAVAMRTLLQSLLTRMGEVSLLATQKAIEGVETSVPWGQFPIAEAQMPLAHGVGGIPQVSQGLWHQFNTGVHPSQVSALDLAGLHADLERIPVGMKFANGLKYLSCSWLCCKHLCPKISGATVN